MTKEKAIVILAVILVVLGSFWFFVKPPHQKACNRGVEVGCFSRFQSFTSVLKCEVFWCGGEKSEAPIIQNPSVESDTNLDQATSSGAVAEKITLSGIPLSNPQKRITKKPFGTFITPQNSPISPEKFSGYHTGTDFEIFPEEANADVEVRAICEGKILQKKKVSGYGGVIIQSCVLDGEKVAVLYGHLKLSDAPAEIGKTFFRGNRLAILGAGGSADTDGERKHLHLGIKKGSQIDVRGYVSDKSGLTGWLDPEKIIFPPVL